MKVLLLLRLGLLLDTLQRILVLVKRAVKLQVEVFTAMDQAVLEMTLHGQRLLLQPLVK